MSNTAKSLQQAKQPEFRLVNLNEIKHELRLVTLSESQEHYEAIRNSISQDGLLHPLLLSEINGELRIIDGFLRFKALIELDFKAYPCKIIQADEPEAVVLAITSNRSRDWKIADYIEAATQLRKHFPPRPGARTDKSGEGKYDSNESIAKLLGVSTRTIHRYSEIHRFSIHLMEALDQGFVSQHTALDMASKLKAIMPINSTWKAIEKKYDKLMFEKSKKKTAAPKASKYQCPSSEVEMKASPITEHCVKCPHYLALLEDGGENE